MELEEYIKDGFDDSLRDYIKSEEYVSAKQQERGAGLFRKFTHQGPAAGISFLDAATNCNSMLLSESYMHGVIEGIALRNKVVSE